MISKGLNPKGLIPKLVLGLIVFIFVYFIVSELYDTDSTLIGGPKSLLLVDNVLSLSINKRVSIIEIYFRNKVYLSKGHHVYTVKDTITPLAPVVHEVLASRDNKSIQIKVNSTETTSGGLKAYVYFKGIGPMEFPTRKYIKSIALDGSVYSVTEFYDTFLNKNESNLKYYKPLTIKNLSNILALKAGPPSITLVMLILVVVLFTQFSLVWLTIIKSVIKKEDINLGENATFPINVIDIISEDYAIIFGFLGTVLSMWVALERSELDYSNFLEVLSLVKIAIFTTVMGLAIRILYGGRQFVFKLQNIIRGKQK